jgi:O-methyltransferase involved in polyketide biosynthesis
VHVIHEPGSEGDASVASRTRFDVPTSARVWNYLLGGHDNYIIDRTVADAMAEVNPQVFHAAGESRRFVARAVRYLTEQGVRQFIDIGAGLPTDQNTHQIAQAIEPRSKIVYVDNDPVVLAYARGWMVAAPDGVTACVDADLHEPENIIAGAREVLDLTEPVGLLIVGTLSYVASTDQAVSILDQLMAAVPAGSYLALEHSSDTSEKARRCAARYAQSGAKPYHPRSPEQLAQLLTGLELVEPGLVPTPQWRPDEDNAEEALSVDRFAAVAHTRARG